MQVASKVRRMIFRRDDIEAALQDNEVRPCITRQATPEECIQYGIIPGACKDDKPKQQYPKRWA